MKNFTKTDPVVRGTFVTLALVLTLTVACSSGAQSDTSEPRTQLVGAARKPLVLVGGQTEQIPSADYLSSPGGASFNATPATGAGDIEVTTINGAAPAVSGSGLYGKIMSATPTFASTGLTTVGHHPIGGTATNSTQGISLYGPGQGNNNSPEEREMAAPATPYSIKILAACSVTLNTDSNFEFGWGQTGSGGKATTIIWNPSGTAGSALANLRALNFNSYTSFNSTAFSATGGTLADHVIWFKLSDDGTTARMYYSATGDDDDWINFFSVTESGSFLGAGNYNLIVFGASGFAADVRSEILSWTITSP